jgi:2-polyprenyl-6-methoxyphenol hydroxylase-like FAD-dependent oxidoreductase
MFADEERSKLTILPINVIGVVRHITAQDGAAVRALDPLLFSGLHPKTQNYLWYSVQQIYDEADGSTSWDALVLVSWKVRDPERDAIPPTNRLRIANMKRRAEEFVEPLRGLVLGIADEEERVTPLTLADFPNADWEGRENVTLAGDAAHAMTMYRGEGANHGLLDAALLVDQLVKVREGAASQAEAIAAYEKEMKPRARAAVLQSRKACLDGHSWEDINDDSPLIGGRVPPATA